MKPEVVWGIQEQLTRGSCVDLWGHASSFNRARTGLMVGLCLEVTLQRGEGALSLHVAARMQVRTGWKLPSDDLRLPLTPSAGRVLQASGHSVSEHSALGLPGSFGS